MKLELYKPYKTKNGHKAVPIEINGKFFEVSHMDNGQVTHYEDGLPCYASDYFTIISEWDEGQ